MLNICPTALLRLSLRDMEKQPISFYNASAGSGKTYTLAKKYLTILLSEPFNNGYRKILAVTFTNKAVSEMKERILSYLESFSREPIPEDDKDMFNQVITACGLTAQQGHQKAKKVYKKLLHDYSAFDIVTIDSFNHRILRTFAKDMDIAPGFEVSLDKDSLVNKAISRVIARAGKDDQLTQVLIDFSLSKIDEGKSWDILYDLNEASNIIGSESDYIYLQELLNYKISDFKNLRKQLLEKRLVIRDEIIKIGKHATQLIAQAGLQKNEFSGGNGYQNVVASLYKMATGDFEKINTETKTYAKLLNGEFTNKNPKPDLVSRIEPIGPDLQQAASRFLDLKSNWLLFNNYLSNVTPLSIIGEILDEIEVIKQEEQILPIHEFNSLLEKEIANQPAPFIYERLGERYRHYFIDEFQDTSTMQWSNLKPLISNAVTSEDEQGKSGSLMLVGDGKQSIYRWRGGDIDQFVELSKREQLFYVGVQKENLGTNWRSHKNIIEFNNKFFKYYSSVLSSNPHYSLYEGKNLEQGLNSKKREGYVQLDFMNPTVDELIQEKDETLKNGLPLYIERVVHQITNRGYNYRDICVLVRSNSLAIKIAKYLSEQTDIEVISAESLLVQNSKAVRYLTSALTAIMYPKERSIKADLVLDYVAFHDLKDTDTLLREYTPLSIDELLDKLGNGEEGIYDAFAKANLYQAIEQLTHALGIFTEMDPRLLEFMEYIYDYSQDMDASLLGLLEKWSVEKGKKSIPAADSLDAIQIMTIHKSKGLEFPVVIVPNLEENVSAVHNKSVAWAPLETAQLDTPIHHMLINQKKEAAIYPSPVDLLYQEELKKAEIDTINLVYVAFTRASEQLYVINDERLLDKNEENITQLLGNYAIGNTEFSHMAHDLGNTYYLGNEHRPGNAEDKKTTTVGIKPLAKYQQTNMVMRTAFSTKKGQSWATGSDQARVKGIIAHKYLALVDSVKDLESVMEQVNMDRYLDQELKAEIKDLIQQVVQHPELEHYYDPLCEVMNERTILTTTGDSYIPDRIVVKDGIATIIDYKTGSQKQKDREQVDYYANLLTTMGYQIKEKVLIYTDQLFPVKWN